MVPRSPQGRGNFERGREGLPWAVEKWLNWSRCHFRTGVHTGATCWMPLNHPCATAMRSFVKLLWPLVIIMILASDISWYKWYRVLSVSIDTAPDTYWAWHHNDTVNAFVAWQVGLCLQTSMQWAATGYSGAYFKSRHIGKAGWSGAKEGRQCGHSISQLSTEVFAHLNRFEVTDYSSRQSDDCW